MLKCPLCRRSFLYRAQLESHVEGMHGEYCPYNERPPLPTELAVDDGTQALDDMVDNARDLGLTYDPPTPANDDPPPLAANEGAFSGAGASGSWDSSTSSDSSSTSSSDSGSCSSGGSGDAA